MQQLQSYYVRFAGRLLSDTFYAACHEQRYSYF